MVLELLPVQDNPSLWAISILHCFVLLDQYSLKKGSIFCLVFQRKGNLQTFKKLFVVKVYINNGRVHVLRLSTVKRHRRGIKEWKSLAFGLFISSRIFLDAHLVLLAGY